MTPEEMRGHAEDIILSHVRDVECLSIDEHLEDALAGMTGAEADEVCRKVDDLIRTATVTVEWDDQGEDVDAEEVGPST